MKAKYRESCRAFAPSVLQEDVNNWFEHDTDSPYMLFVANVKIDKRRTLAAEENSPFEIDKLNVTCSLIPAIIHVDYSARIQTIRSDTNPRYHALISKFNDKTVCPLVIDTSLNVCGEPIICTPTDAFKCFMDIGLDALTVGNYLLVKEQQDKSLKEDYKVRYEPN